MNKRPKVRAYSVVSNPFRFGFLVMARTLVRQNPELDISFRVLWHPDLCPLNKDVQAWLSGHLDDVDFVEVVLDPYTNIFELRDREFRTPKRLWAAFLILEAFRDESDEHHVICLDSDLVCLGKLDDAIMRDSGFAAVEARTDDGLPLGFFNTGVMALARDVRGLKRYSEIMSIRSADGYNPKSGRADQALLSLIYTPNNASCLPWRYNVTKRHVPREGVEGFLHGMDAVFYHYVGAKPWHVSLDIRDRYDRESVLLWDRIVTEHLDSLELIEYLESWRDESRAISYAWMDVRLSRVQLPVRSARHYARLLVRKMRKWAVRLR